MRRFLGDSYICIATAALLALLSSGVAAASTHSLGDVQRAAETAVHRDVRVTHGTLYATAVPLDPRLALTACAQALQARSSPVRAGMTRALVSVSCVGPVPWTINVPVFMEIEQAVLITRAPVARGVSLASDDVRVETRRVPGISTRYLGGVQELAHKTTRRPLAAGEVVVADALAPAMVIKRGQSVTIIAEEGGVAIRTGGRAMADAPLQGRIRVQNANSLRIVEGIVESADTVRVGR